MSETDVPQQAEYSDCCGQMSEGQGEHRMSGSIYVKKTAEAVFFGEGISLMGCSKNYIMYWGVLR